MSKSVVYAIMPEFIMEISAVEFRGRSDFHNSVGVLTDLVARPRVQFHVMNALCMATGIAFLAAVVHVPETPAHLLANYRTNEA